jgi:signal peptidase II
MKQNKILWISLIILILDQATKLIIKSTMSLHDSISVFGNFLRITYIENSGMAFGLHVGNNVFFTIFTMAASIAILLYIFKMKGEHFIARLSLAIIFGGAMGNLTDRILRGQVVDFFDCEFFDINIPSFKFFFFNFTGYSMDRWPIFNVADMAVTIGMILLLIFIGFTNEQQKEDPSIIQETGTEIIR